MQWTGWHLPIEVAAKYPSGLGTGSRLGTAFLERDSPRREGAGHQPSLSVHFTPALN
jgi:hypothetical protein